MTTDEEPVLAEPDRLSPTHDAEAPGPDAVEQASEVSPGRRVSRISDDFEVPEADAIEQATELPAHDPMDG